MDKRATVGLLFSFTEGWIGGSYYFLNLIAALNTLDEAQKPLVIIYSDNRESYELAKETGYPYLDYACSNFSYNLAQRAINKTSRLLTGQSIIKKSVPKEVMPLLFGYYEQLCLHYANRKIYWMPDFQEYYYPNFIGVDSTKRRQVLHRRVIDEKADLIFSSADGLNDFKKIYPPNTSRTFIVRFSVTHPDYSNISIENLREKYKLADNYFFTPNQFWPHKNHLTILKAVKRVKDAGIDIHFAFSGKYNLADEHVKKIQQFIDENNLSENINLLGFIDRKDQLCIMKNSLAVVQPSYFEGWSTVVEDAKAMGKFLILSDLRVHREQTEKYNADLFGVEDDEELAAHLIKAIKSKPADADYNYGENIKAFAADFLKAITA